jgi:hypothetical protein
MRPKAKLQKDPRVPTCTSIAGRVAQGGARHGHTRDPTPRPSVAGPSSRHMAPDHIRPYIPQYLGFVLDNTKLTNLAKIKWSCVLLHFEFSCSEIAGGQHTPSQAKSAHLDFLNDDRWVLLPDVLELVVTAHGGQPS